MRTQRTKRLKWHHGVFSIVLPGFLFLAACSGNAPRNSAGNLVFQASFSSPEADTGLSRTADAIDVCSEYGIQTIRAKVIDSNGNIRGEGSWPCDIDGHKGTINQIRSGSGYRLVTEGIIGGSIRWRGEVSNITVTAGQTTNAGMVAMTAVGQYPIAASAGGGGSIEPNGTISVVLLGTQTFTINPEPNFKILDVAVDGRSVGAVQTYVFAGVEADHTIRATFTPMTYTVTASAGNGGRIDPSGQQTASFGDSPSFAITADPGFYLSAVLINGSMAPPRNPYVIGHISADTSIHAVFSAVVFVDAGAQDGGDGNSWSRALNNVQAAVEASSEGGDIWMKSGTYALSSQIRINKAVTIYGGFDGHETLLEARDAAANATVIDGGLTTRCFFIDADATLDGLSIRNGRHTTDLNGQGGGVYIDHASPHLINCRLINNALNIPGTAGRGGAVYVSAGAPVIDNCSFENNFTSNAAQPSEGGAFYNNGGSSTISDSTFVNNRAPGNESAAGAVFNNGGTSTITGCRFIGNQAGPGSSGSGGAIFNNGGMHAIADSLFRDNLAQGSAAARGGAIYNSDAVLTLTNTIFLENEARNVQSGHGGAIFNANSDPFITNCTISANRAVGSEDPFAMGGAIYNLDSRPTIVNSIVWGNVADQETAVFDAGASLTTVNYSDIDGSSVGGTGNIDMDPLLDNRGHLTSDSPCIDTGDDTYAPEADIDGETRPQGSRSDMGADEYVDSDGDGLPDFWEELFGLNVGSDDSGDDLDGDRASNAFEYRHGLDPSQVNPVLDASQRGNYAEGGDHDQNDDSTPAGRLAGPMHRSYFIFPLSGIADTVTVAVLRLEVVNYASVLASDTLELYDVSTNPATLELSGTGESGIFNDLGTGIRYAQVSVGPGDVGKILEIPLPESALSDINAMRGGSFPVGLALTVAGVVSTEFVTFSSGTEARVHQLVLGTR